MEIITCLRNMVIIILMDRCTEWKLWFQKSTVQKEKLNGPGYCRNLPPIGAVCIMYLLTVTNFTFFAWSIRMQKKNWRQVKLLNPATIPLPAEFQVRMYWHMK